MSTDPDADPYASPEAQEKLRQDRAAQHRNLRNIPNNPFLEQLAIPQTDQERASARKELRNMHRANRFRLMFGQPLLSDAGEPQDHEPTSTKP